MPDIEKISFKENKYYKICTLFNKRCKKDKLALIETTSAAIFSPFMWFPETRGKLGYSWSPDREEYYKVKLERCQTTWAIEFWDIKGYAKIMRNDLERLLEITKHDKKAIADFFKKRMYSLIIFLKFVKEETIKVILMPARVSPIRAAGGEIFTATQTFRSFPEKPQKAITGYVGEYQYAKDGLEQISRRAINLFNDAKEYYPFFVNGYTCDNFKEIDASQIDPARAYHITYETLNNNYFSKLHNLYQGTCISSFIETWPTDLDCWFEEYNETPYKEVFSLEGVKGKEKQQRYEEIKERLFLKEGNDYKPILTAEKEKSKMVREERLEYEEDINLNDENYSYNLLGLEIDYIDKQPRVKFKLLNKSQDRETKAETTVKKFSKSEKDFALLTRLAVAVKTKEEGWIYINGSNMDKEGKPKHDHKGNTLYLKSQELEKFRETLAYRCKIFNLSDKEKRGLVRTRTGHNQVRLAIPKQNIHIVTENVKKFKPKVIGTENDAQKRGIKKITMLMKDARKSL